MFKNKRIVTLQKDKDGFVFAVTETYDSVPSPHPDIEHIEINEAYEVAAKLAVGKFHDTTTNKIFSDKAQMIDTGKTVTPKAIT